MIIYRKVIVVVLVIKTHKTWNMSGFYQILKIFLVLNFFAWIWIRIQIRIKAWSRFGSVTNFFRSWIRIRIKCYRSTTLFKSISLDYTVNWNSWKQCECFIASNFNALAVSLETFKTSWLLGCSGLRLFWPATSKNSTFLGGGGGGHSCPEVLSSCNGTFLCTKGRKNIFCCSFHIFMLRNWIENHLHFFDLKFFKGKLVLEQKKSFIML